jgi:WD40 repeat protein
VFQSSLDKVTSPSSKEIVGFEFVPDLQSLCLASSNGEIFTVDLNSEKIECVGSIESGITAMSWSPDFEIVLFTNGDGNMLLMTQEWDVVHELPLIPSGNSSNDERANQTSRNHSILIRLFNGVLLFCLFIYSLRLSILLINLLAPSHLSRTMRPNITWRGDGNFFAISTHENGIICLFERRAFREYDIHMWVGVCALFFFRTVYFLLILLLCVCGVVYGEGKYLFRVWDRKCELNSTSEPTPGQGPLICWK